MHPESVRKKGFTIPTFNFCGPGNSQNYLPRQRVFCQYHDMEYAYRPSSLEIENDTQFKHMSHQWSAAFIGDGWNGPTIFERNIIIPMILEAFHSEEVATEPWAKMIIPSNVMNLMTHFKTYSENYKDDWSDWKKI